MEIGLEGKWFVRLDRKREGSVKKYFTEDFGRDRFCQQAGFPGSLEENSIGDIVCETDDNDVSNTLSYSGWAWFQRKMVFPDTKGKITKLFFERIPWESTLWIDDVLIGSYCSLSAPHIYDISKLELCGEHVITLMTDNSNYNSGADTSFDRNVYLDYEGRDINCHLVTPTGQAKIPCGGHGTKPFSGITGGMKLISEDTAVTRLNVYPDVDNAEITIRLQTEGKKADNICFTLLLDGKEISSETRKINPDGEYRMKVSPLKLWSEFEQPLYTLELSLTNEKSIIGTGKVRFGMRKLSAEGKKICMNGSPVFLRGTLEGDAFPETCYHPCDKAFWMKVFGVMKEYGLNHLRCHTFCPPEAAFDAADETGIYIQAELPGTSCPTKDEAPIVHRFLMSELKRMLDEFGNHPSFCFVSMGNEQLIYSDKAFLERHAELLEEKVKFGQKYDSRHLYTATSHPYSDGRCDDFYISAGNKAGYDIKPFNGITWGGPDPRACSRFCTDRPSLDYSYDAADEISKPVISHEVGQWAVYPDFRDAVKFKGVQHPGNYMHIARSLREHGLSDYAYRFMMASGKLSLELYKEEIESALRTNGLSGFQLLDIHDYPGQGTSTVGILNVFWESKGLCTAEEFRSFCSPVVPLFCCEKRVYTDVEIIGARVKIANYSDKKLTSELTVRATAEDRVIFEKHFDNITAENGMTDTVAEVSIDLIGITKASKVTVTVEFAGFANSWKLWVYPEKETVDPEGIIISHEFDKKTEDSLFFEGKDVLLLAKGDTNGPKGVFTTVFWNPFMKQQEGWMGILCDPDAAVFEDFPTDYHSDWQWWDIVMRSKAMIFDGEPELLPMIRVIDSTKDNRNLGLLFEAKVGKGRLIVCSADIDKDADDNPASRQLLRSVIKYMKSDKFDPGFSTYPYRIRRLLSGEKA